MRKSHKFVCCFCILMLGCLSALAGGEKPEKAGKKVVYYLSPNKFDEFQTTASKLLKNAITAKGYEFRELVAGNEDVTLQLNQIEDAITQDADAIIVAAVDRTAIVDGVEKARAKGIPVIAFDRKILDTKTILPQQGETKKLVSSQEKSRRDSSKRNMVQ
jgi:ABC-type sugar transport system substrate-binding protein